MNCRYKIGLRTIKTVLAVFACLLIKMIFNRQSVLFAAIAAVICMQQTPQKSLSTGIHRFIGTVIGALFGFLILEIVPFIPSYYELSYIFIIPLGMLLAMYFCTLFNQRTSISICCVVFLSIVTNFGRDIQGTGTYVLTRIIDTTIGIVVATLINKYFFPYQQDDCGDDIQKICEETKETEISKPKKTVKGSVQNGK